MAGNRRNLVLITADSVRADHCGFTDAVYNPDTTATDAGLTPRLDGMATEGVGFTTAVSPGPRTPSSVPEMMTGSYMPHDHVDPEDWELRMERIRQHMLAVMPLAVELRDAGYTTMAFSGSPHTGTHTLFDRGFDEFVKLGRTGGMNLDALSGTPLEPFAQRFTQLWNQTGSFSSWPDSFEEIVASAEDADEPFFLWVFLLDTHSPYRAPRSDRVESSLWSMYMGQLRANSIFKDVRATANTSYGDHLSTSIIENVKKAYRDSIRSVDRCVGALRDELDDADPVVMFTSDHGEGFGEHGTFGHQRRFYEENVRVPFVVHGTETTEHVTELVTLRCLSDMICSYVADGTSFADDQWHRDHVLIRSENNEAFGLRTGRWKYIWSEGDDTEQLFDLWADPAETDDRSSKQSSAGAELREVLNDSLAELPSVDGYDRAPDEYDGSIERQLRELGYID